ncbi:MAG: hypothetical protein KAJ51_02860, partial [Thermoplasmata archaeon]|nr:hypothetical protein [Thermoplasmata archaeon]
LQQDYINKTATILSNEFQLSSKPGEEYTHTYGYALTVNYKDHMKSNRLVFSLGTDLPDREVIYYDSLEKNKWYRIAASYDGTYMKLYVNYEEVASKEAIGLHPDTPNNLQIGKCPTWDYPINAIIDDVHISEGAKLPDQMLIDIVSHEEWFEELNNWIAENGIIWVGTGGYEFYYLSLKGQNWPNERVPLRSEGLAEFTEVGLPALELNIANKICTITEIGNEVMNTLPKANMPLEVISSRTIPNTHDIFTIPIYSDGDVVSHGVIPIGKGKFIHSGTYNAEIIASTATWLYTNGKIQMVFLIDVPETVGGTEPLVVESQHPYPTKYGTNPNLLTNPGAESGSMSGWNILADGGNGWRATGGGYEGNYHFLTSYSWCKRYQELDLLTKGYSTDQLNASPTIYAEEWFCGSSPNYGDSYYLKVELRDGNHNPIASYDSGTNKATTSWQKLSHTFSNYGSGLRYIYWEDGGDDAEYWRGYYGARLDAAFLTIATAEYEDLWKIDKKDVNRMRVHFEKYEVGDEGDYIQLLDKENIEIARYTGFSNSDEWSPWCEGDIIKVKLVTSSNRHFWGFKINQIEYLSSGKSVSHPIGQDEIKSKLTELESSIGTNCIFRTISSTDQFKDLVESRLETPLVINLHGNAIPIPESYLTGAMSATTPPLGYSSGGLSGEYYDNEGFTNLKEARIDSEINFNWGQGSPSIDVQGDTFSARWTGKIRIDYSEEYTFYVRTDDGTRVWIDKNQDGDFEDPEELVIDSWILQPPTEHQGKIKLTPDYYDIKYEYYEHYGYAVAELYWSSKSV